MIALSIHARNGECVAVAAADFVLHDALSSHKWAYVASFFFFCCMLPTFMRGDRAANRGAREWYEIHGVSKTHKIHARKEKLARVLITLRYALP